jgi:mannose-1-phosphate guanylyltransferase
VNRWIVVLAGGVGSRFWPLSTPSHPKQMLPLIDDRPLLRATLDRLTQIAEPEHTLILTNSALVEAIGRLAPEIPPTNLVAEPKPAGTAAALTWAANAIARRPDGGEDAVMISVHADWAIGDPAGFCAALLRAADVALRHQVLVTVGVVPTRPDPGFGYIHPGDEIASDSVARKVARFVEKPDQQQAASMVRDGYLWNSGIFVWRVGDFLAEVRAHTPEVAPALLAHGDDTAEFFTASRSISVDVGVLERSDRVAVIPGKFGWDDVGTWSALRRVRALDASGNAASGSVHTLDAEGNVVHAEGTDVVLFGVADLVVVASAKLTFVTSIDRATDIKTLVESLPREVRERT